jgi:hypothetical protein
MATKTPKLIDARQIAVSSPATFSCPARSETAEVKPGDLVKVCAPFEPTGQTQYRNERFWVLVTGRAATTLTGTVHGNLMFGFIHGLHEGDVIQMDEVNIYAIRATKKVQLGVSTGPEVVRTALCTMQVCVPEAFTNAQVEQFANSNSPTGIATPWVVVAQGEPPLNGDNERVPCEKREGCCHLLLVC